jgi:hypothetical protein
MPTSVGINATSCVAEEIGWASNGVGLTQKADDLFFRKSLLHVQSPGQVGLDSKSLCYSKPGGRRNDAQLNTLFALSNLWMARRRMLPSMGQVRP